MLHQDVTIAGFAAEDWSRMLALLGEGRTRASELLPSTFERAMTTDGDAEPGAALPSPAFVADLLDIICPNERAMVIGIFESGELWTGAAFSRREGAIDAIVGPAALREGMGLLSGDWRRDYRHLARAAEERVGSLSLGCFAELETVRRLSALASPGAWARAVAVRDVIISPFPAEMALPLGWDAARASMAALRSLSNRLELPDMLRRLLNRTA